MNAIHQLLTDHIDIWTAADTEKKSGRGRSSGNAVSVYGIKKLRELILELAVRGKLVPQDPSDEPAGELLKRIQAEKAKLIAEGKIKKNKLLATITDQEKLFEIPQNWEWVRLGSLGDIKGGKRLPAGASFSSTETPFVYIQVTNMKNGTIVEENLKYIDEKTQNAIKQYIISSDDLYITIAGTIGDVGSIPNRFDGMNLTENAAKIVFSSVNKEWLIKALRSMSVKMQFVDKAIQMAQPKLALHRVADSVLALPPIEEQHRIVAKVDELMALCDQLETQHSNAAEAHEKLVSHLLGTLTQSSNTTTSPLCKRGAGGDLDWQRVAAHFDTLFTTEASIDALKQTLLQLAVMGKLVPQDPNDEPASELLKRIQAEKAKLIAEGKIKKDKPLAPINDEEKLFDLPNGWEWGRLGELVEKSGAGWSPSCEGHPRIENDWGVLKVSAVSWGKFLPDENKALPKILDARLDCVVESGDFLLSRANTAELVARSVVVEDCPPNLMLSDKIVRLRLSLFCDSRFINIANSSSYARTYYSLVAGGTSSSMKNVTREQILNLIVGTPPLAEQHRIVAKVDELMAICDQLKSRITKANQLQQKLADVVVEQAIS